MTACLPSGWPTARARRASLGAAAVARPVPLPDAARHFDLPVMLAVCLACVPVFLRGRVIARWEGALFLAYYAAYTAYLILAAAQHETLPRFSNVMFCYVIPITPSPSWGWRSRTGGRGGG